jgi:SNF2 family DNA or RNA helicase
LIAEDTVKEEILALQQQTRDLVDAILVQDSALIRRLTAEGLDSALS